MATDSLNPAQSIDARKRVASLAARLDDTGWMPDVGAAVDPVSAQRRAQIATLKQEARRFQQDAARALEAADPAAVGKANRAVEEGWARLMAACRVARGRYSREAHLQRLRSVAPPRRTEPRAGRARRRRQRRQRRSRSPDRPSDDDPDPEPVVAAGAAA